MKATIDGKTYDSSNERSAQISHALFDNDGTDELRQTTEGDFFLVQENYYVDGRKLDHDERAEELVPSFLGEAEWRRRVECKLSIVPLTHRQALEWRIKARVPETFRGYLLDLL